MLKQTFFFLNTNDEHSLLKEHPPGLSSNLGPGPRALTQRVLQVLDQGALLQTVLPLHIVRRDVACPVGGVAHPPPCLGVVQQPQALVLLDIQLLVLLGHVVPLGYHDDLLCHLSWSPLRQNSTSETLQTFPWLQLETLFK